MPFTPFPSRSATCHSVPSSPVQTRLLPVLSSDLPSSPHSLHSSSFALSLSPSPMPFSPLLRRSHDSVPPSTAQSRQVASISAQLLPVQSLPAQWPSATSSHIPLNTVPSSPTRFRPTSPFPAHSRYVLLSPAQRPECFVIPSSPVSPSPG